MKGKKFCGAKQLSSLAVFGWIAKELERWDRTSASKGALSQPLQSMFWSHLAHPDRWRHHDIGAYEKSGPKSVFQLLPLDARHFPDCLKHLQGSFNWKYLIQTVNGIYPAYSLWWVSWGFVKISFFIYGNIIIKKIAIEWTSDEFKSRAWKSSWMNFDGVSSLKFLDATLAWDALSKASRMYIYFVPKYLNCVLINRRLSMILVQ